MFKWAERNSIPEYSHEMLHYRNAMVKEINFAFSENYSDPKKNEAMKEEFEKIKDFREKTANRLKKESDTNKVWLDLFLDIFRSGLDFTSADLLLKYYNIPNEVIFPDFYYLMKSEGSLYKTLIKEQAYQSVFGFMHFFPASDTLTEYGLLLRSAVNNKNTEGIMFLIDHLNERPFDVLKKDDEIKDIVKKEYLEAEKNKRLHDAQKIANTLGDSDRLNRVKALEAMMNNNAKEAVKYLRSIHDMTEFQPTVKEYYTTAINLGKENNNVDLFKTAYAYAEAGKLGEIDPRFLKEPAEKLFEHHVTKLDATEMDYYEAEKYVSSCEENFVQNIVSRQMLNLIKDNNKKTAKNLKTRFNVKFQPGEYTNEKEVRGFYQNLTETYGALDIPKGEECLMTASDISELFNFGKSDINDLKIKIFRFYLVNKLIDKAKKYYDSENSEIKELIVKQISSFIISKNFKSAYKIADSFPIKLSRELRSEKVRELKGLTSGSDENNDDLAKAIVLDHIFDLKKLPRSFYYQTFQFGLTSGKKGVQILVDLSIPFNRHMNACGKIMLSNTIKRLMATDKISADILASAYKNNTHPDVFDWIIYVFRKVFGAC